MCLRVGVSVYMYVCVCVIVCVNVFLCLRVILDKTAVVLCFVPIRIGTVQ